MKFQPYKFQAAGIDHACSFFASASRDAKQLYAAPTGTGKSVVELLLQERVGDGCWIVTPREEIVHGMLDKLGCPDADMVDKRICTPIRLRNALLQGRYRHPTAYIFDETHHHNAESWQQLDLLSGFAPSVGYTATPYRGTPKSTKEFLDRWGEPLWLITYKEAAAEKYIRIPSFEVLPLVDDDIIDVKSGDFEITSIDAATVDRLGDLAEHSRKWYSTKWDKPTIYALPSSTACRRFQDEMHKRDLPCAVVSASTPKAERQPIFEAVTARILALLHINIVSEGVDLPLRRLVDVAPTLSPVKWVQQLGRITRPTSEQPEYVCTNRNILRHAYALEGAVPISAVVEAERKFPQSTRPHVRALGLEALGRFKSTTTKLISGATLSVYSLSAVASDGVIVEYCCLVHPTMEPIWASKVNVVVDGQKQYGKWAQCEAPNDVRGFSSLGQKEPSEKQMKWWQRSAARHGLDPEQEVNRKNFQALPVLFDTGARFL